MIIVGATINNTGSIVGREDQNWIDKTRHIGVGHYEITARQGLFEAAPRCLCSTTGSVGVNVRALSQSATELTIHVTGDAGDPQDVGFHIVCFGVEDL